MNNIQAATKTQSLTRGYNSAGIESGLPAKKYRSSSLENVTVPLSDETVANILAFYPCRIRTEIDDIDKILLKIYKDTIVKRLHVTKEMVDALGNSDITHLFHKLNKLNHELTAFAIDMGFSLKQIATIPSDQLSEYKDQFDAYEIPFDIQNQIDNLSEINGELKLNGQGLTTGQLCKILNALTDDQRSALTKLTLFDNQLTSLPDSFGDLTALSMVLLENNNFDGNLKHAIQQRYNGQITVFHI